MIRRGVKFGNIHSFYDLDLILAPFTPSPASVKSEYLDIPGMDGSLDMTEAHGELKYYDREFAFTFTINPLSKRTFDENVSLISNALNGKRCNIILDRDSEYYWEGRCFVNEYLQDKKIGKVVIIARVRPYKMKCNPTVVVCQLTGAEQTITLTNGKKPVVPKITCTNANTKVEFGAFEETLNAGTHEFLDIRFTEGKNILKVSGNGTITITYQEGDL